MSMKSDYFKATTAFEFDLEGGKTDEEYHVPSEEDYNCCLRILIKIFKKMYPSHPKEVFTKEGKTFRMVILLFTIGNIISFVSCLAFVGFVCMMLSLCVLLISYSAYLSLREWVICLYVLICLGVVGEQIKELLTLTNHQQMIAGFVLIVFNLLQAVVVCKQYIKFRNTGGLKGTNKTPDMTPVTNVANAVGN